jgi:hypothetical protein
MMCSLRTPFGRCREARVRSAADRQRGRVDLVAQDRGLIGVELAAEMGIVEPRLAILGALGEMQQYVGEGLGHVRVVAGDGGKGW